MSMMRGPFNLAGVAFVASLLAVWEASCRSGVIKFTSVPAPSDVGRALVQLTSSGLLIDPLVHTLSVVAVGSVVSLAIGLLFGTTLGLAPGFAAWTMASVDFMRTIPVVALLPVAVLLWGPSTKSELIITAYAATWVMVVNTAGGFRAVHPRLGDVGHTLRLSRTSTLRKIWIPAVTPSLLVGARLSVVSAVLTAIIAETFVSPAGLGWELIRSQQALRANDLWAYAFTAGLLGYLLNVILIVLVRVGTPGGRDNPALLGA